VHFVVEPKEFDKLVEDIAVKLASGPPLTQKLIKGLLYYGAQADQRTALFLEAAISGDAALTKDLNEGITAMNYRRPPKYTGK
jgi:enoyl-CoA hydratase/carnithine racemase